MGNYEARIASATVKFHIEGEKGGDSSALSSGSTHPTPSHVFYEAKAVAVQLQAGLGPGRHGSKWRRKPRWQMSFAKLAGSMRRKVTPQFWKMLYIYLN